MTITFKDKPIHRLVIKVGSSLLVGDNALDTNFMATLIRQIVDLRSKGVGCVLVSSGAIASAFRILKRSVGRLTLPESQAYSAIGQTHLMNSYNRLCASYGLITAQVLLTADDCRDRLRYLNTKHTLTKLLKEKILPIVNQNDTVAVDEICFGDNDILGALVTNLVQADLFVILTQTDGLYNYQSQTRVSCVRKIDESIYALIQEEKTPLGKGGMFSKIKAAEILSRSGEDMVIASGHTPNVLTNLFHGHDIGTHFIPKFRRLSGRRKWIAFAGRSAGKITIDEGACEALLKGGKSLLSSGVLNCSEEFQKGDIVSVFRNGVCVARGLTNFSAENLMKIKGLPSAEAQKILCVQSYDEVIHRNNLVVMSGEDKVS